MHNFGPTFLFSCFTRENTVQKRSFRLNFNEGSMTGTSMHIYPAKGINHDILTLQEGSIMPIRVVFWSAFCSKRSVCWWISIRIDILDKKTILNIRDLLACFNFIILLCLTKGWIRICGQKIPDPTKRSRSERIRNHHVMLRVK